MSQKNAEGANPTQTALFAESALRTISLEQAAVAELATRIDGAFEQACQLLMDCSARIVLVGMGKSGHIANKIAANGPIAVQAIRKSARACLGVPEMDALKIETLISAPVFKSEDAAEGPRAFMEKRKPIYKGR